MIKLFIGGFPLEMSELEVVQLVAPYVDVVTIKLVRNKKTKICKGYGFIEVADAAQVQQAVENLNGHTLGDRELSLNIVPEQPAKPAATNPKIDSPKWPRRPRI